MDDAVVDLWISVLWQAAYDYHGRYGADELDQADAREWFDAPVVRVGSFAWICYHLHLDPSYVRKKLLEEAKPKVPAALRVKHTEPAMIDEHLWTATTLGASGEVTAA